MAQSLTPAQYSLEFSKLPKCSSEQLYNKLWNHIEKAQMENYFEGTSKQVAVADLALADNNRMLKYLYNRGKYINQVLLTIIERETICSEISLRTSIQIKKDCQKCQV